MTEQDIEQALQVAEDSAEGSPAPAWELAPAFPAASPHRRSGASGIPTLERGNDQFNIPLPPTESELRRIADCLASLDDLINAQTQKLAVLKTHKKGLMQQLFPVPDPG